MWHIVTTLVAAAFFAMVACDTSVEPGEEPDSTTTVDTWSATDSGKGDGPNQPDTNTADTGSVPNIVVPLPASQCPTLVSSEERINEIWYRQNKRSEMLDVSVSAQSNGLCLIAVNRTHLSNGTAFFEGNTLPISTDLPDQTIASGHYTITLYLEDSLLKIKFDDNSGTTWVICYER